MLTYNKITKTNISKNLRKYKAENNRRESELLWMYESGRWTTIDKRRRCIVFSDIAAGKVWIDIVYDNQNWTYEKVGGKHSSVLYETDDYCDAVRWKDKYISDSTRYLVVYTEDYEDMYIVKMNANSGTYGENGIDTSMIVSEFDSITKAERYIHEHL